MDHLKDTGLCGVAKPMLTHELPKHKISCWAMQPQRKPRPRPQPRPWHAFPCALICGLPRHSTTLISCVMPRVDCELGGAGLSLCRRAGQRIHCIPLHSAVALEKERLRSQTPRHLAFHAAQSQPPCTQQLPSHPWRRRGHQP